VKRRCVCRRPRAALGNPGYGTGFWLGVVTSLVANVVTIAAVEAWRARKKATP
jgi:hypothetical protein